MRIQVWLGTFIWVIRVHSKFSMLLSSFEVRIHNEIISKLVHWALRVLNDLVTVVDWKTTYVVINYIWETLIWRSHPRVLLQTVLWSVLPACTSALRGHLPLSYYLSWVQALRHILIHYELRIHEAECLDNRLLRNEFRMFCWTSPLNLFGKDMSLHIWMSKNVRGCPSLWSIALVHETLVRRVTTQIIFVTW